MYDGVVYLCSSTLFSGYGRVRLVLITIYTETCSGVMTDLVLMLLVWLRWRKMMV